MLDEQRVNQAISFLERFYIETDKRLKILEKKLKIIEILIEEYLKNISYYQNKYLKELKDLK